ncbi:MAG: sphingomyelin phosphodiesterase [Verrucomicrobia bacterium]|nr:sphingomyelin phosphodiesterase [Verrucomicrobiota bacterium]
MLLPGLLLVLWGCVSPNSSNVQIRHAATAARSGPGQEGQTELRVLTYNIWGLPAWINGANPSRYARIARELEARAPEFILLQEVWSEHAREAVPAEAGWSVASSPARNLFLRRSGLVTLSRHPIVDAEFHAFRAGTWPDSLVGKGALRITVELAGSLRLNVWNVHLQAGDARDIRLRQIAELAAWVRQAEQGQGADIIAGDFNCTPDSEEYRQLTRLLGTDAHPPESQPHFVTYDGCRSDAADARTLDYVFLRLRQSHVSCTASVAPAMDADRPEDRLSDHLAVEADLRLEIAPHRRYTVEASTDLPSWGAWISGEFSARGVSIPVPVNLFGERQSIRWSRLEP